MARVYASGLPHTLALCHIGVYRTQNGVLVGAQDQVSGGDAYGLRSHFTIQYNVLAQATGARLPPQIGRRALSA